MKKAKGPAKDLPLPLETLRQVPLFANLNDEECGQIARAVETKHFQPGEEVLQQGGTCRNLWIVLEGECDVVKRAGDSPTAPEVVLATLGPLENFGEMSFYQAAPHAAAVRARTELKVLRLTREAYSNLVEHGDGAAFKLAYNTVESLAKRLRQMDEWVARLLTENAKKDRAAEWRGFRDKLFKEWNL
jgi:CRP-like cAMP-binding protein